MYVLMVVSANSCNMSIFLNMLCTFYI